MLDNIRDQILKKLLYSPEANTLDESITRAKMLNCVKYTCTIEQYKTIESFINGLNDMEFKALISDYKQLLLKQDSISLKESIKMADRLRTNSGVLPNNSALNLVPAKMLDSQTNDQLNHKIATSICNDVIHFDRESDMKIMSIWLGEVDENTGVFKPTGIPSDVFFAKTVPLLDCRISIDERDMLNGKVVEYRVIIFDDYSDTIEVAADDEYILVGVLISEAKAPSYIIPLYAVKGIDFIIPGNIGWHKMKQQVAQAEIERINYTEQDIASMTVDHMATWYGVQIALLHPMVSEIMKRPRRIAETTKNTKKNKNAKRKVKYIKKHIVNAEDLERLMYGDVDDGKNFTRKALAWYVIGHWRKLPSGKKIFIQPYWKGILRDVKNSIEVEGRQREIIQPEFIE